MLIFAQNISFNDSFNFGDEFSGLYGATFSKEHYFFEYSKLDQNLGFISTTLVRADTKLEDVERIENVSIHNNPTSFISLFEVIDGRLLIGSNVEINSEFYFFTHSYALDFSDHVLHDSIRLNDREIFLSSNFKRLENGNFYSLGNIRLLDVADREIHYVEVNPAGEIIEFQAISGNTDRPSTFARDPSNGNIYMGTLLFNSLLLNSSLQPIDTLEATYWNGNSRLSFSSYFCDFENDKLRCYCTSPSQDEFTFSLLDYSIVDDSLELQNVQPLHPEEREVYVVFWSTIARDAQGNTYVAYQESANQFNGVMPNKLFLSKVDSSDNVIWEIELFDDKGEYGLSTSFVDSEQNLVLTGVCYHIESPNSPRNFVIKVDSKGSIVTSIKDLNLDSSLNVFPNPSSEYISFELEKSTEVDYQIYSIGGLLERQGRVAEISGNFTIETHDLPSGMHILNVFDGGSIYVTRFVKE